jgi:hypothetical protein
MAESVIVQPGAAPARTASERIKQRGIDYRITFSSEAGARVLADLKDTHWIGNCTFTPGSEIETCFREGQRSVVLRILSIMQPEADAPQVVGYTDEEGQDAT